MNLIERLRASVGGPDITNEAADELEHRDELIDYKERQIQKERKRRIKAEKAVDRLTVKNAELTHENESLCDLEMRFERLTADNDSMSQRLLDIANESFEVERLTTALKNQQHTCGVLAKDKERLTAERDALQDSYEGEIENRLSVSRSHEKYVTENERLRAALEDLRGSAQGKDDGWIIDAVDEALQGDSDE